MHRYLFRLFLVIIVSYPLSVWANVATECARSKGEAKILACSQIIESQTLQGNSISKSDLAIAYNNRGAGYIYIANYDQALADLDKAIELYPKYADAYLNRGIALGRQGHVESAVAEYDKAIEANPNHSGAHYVRGLVFAQNGQSDLAIASFDTAIALNPKHAMIYKNRGILYAKSGQFERAITDFRTALRLNPSLQEIKDRLKQMGVDP